MVKYQPRVSIITPFFNASQYIHQYISSVRAQVYRNWLCLLIDDNSTDNSFNILETITLSDPRFLLLKNPDTTSSPGPASARNYALSLVKSELVAFCDVDDLWHPLKLTLQVDALTKYNADIVVTDYSRFSISTSHSVITVDVPVPSCCSYRDLLLRNPIPLLTVLMSSKLAGIRFSTIHHEDYLYWLSIFKELSPIRYHRVPETLAYYRIHSSNITSNKLLMPIWTYNVFRKHGLGRVHSLIRILNWSKSHILNQVYLVWTRLKNSPSPPKLSHPSLRKFLNEESSD